MRRVAIHVSSRLVRPCPPRHPICVSVPPPPPLLPTPPSPRTDFRPPRPSAHHQPHPPTRRLGARHTTVTGTGRRAHGSLVRSLPAASPPRLARPPRPGPPFRSARRRRRASRGAPGTRGPAGSYMYSQTAVCRWQSPSRRPHLLQPPPPHPPRATSFRVVSATRRCWGAVPPPRDCSARGARPDADWHCAAGRGGAPGGRDVWLFCTFRCGVGVAVTVAVVARGGAGPFDSEPGRRGRSMGISS